MQAGIVRWLGAMASATALFITLMTTTAQGTSPETQIDELLRSIDRESAKVQ